MITKTVVEDGLESSTASKHPDVSVVVEPTETTALLNSNDANPAPVAEEYVRVTGPRFWWLFGCIMVGSLLAFFDGTVMASSHPVITSHFKASNSASWLTTVFYLASTISQPLYGRISDLFGRRSVLLFAFTLFFISNAWCALAQSIGSFIAARFVCGIGAGGMTTMTAILISDLVEIESRGIYQSYYNLAWGCGNGLGAAFGGILCDRLGWRAAFGVQLPFIFVDGIIAFVVTPEGLGPNLARSQGKTILQTFQDIDIPGTAALVVTLTCLILGLNLGGNVLSWDHPIVIAALVLFATAFCFLIRIEQRPVKRPILPLRFLLTFPIANLMWSNFLSAILINTVIFNVPLFLQAVRQMSPTMSGLYLIAPLVAASTTGLISGFWITWTRKMKPLMVVGAFCFLVGAIGVTFLASSTPSWAIVLFISGASIGQGLNWPPTTIALLALNPQAEQAVVSTTQGLLRYVGSILGVAISSWIFQNALLIYLNQLVTAPTVAIKEKIIQEVRKSVAAIAELDPEHKLQVIHAYSEALRMAFQSAVIAALLVICLTLPLQLPDLRRKQSKSVAASDTTHDTGLADDQNAEAVA